MPEQHRSRPSLSAARREAKFHCPTGRVLGTVRMTSFVSAIAPTIVLVSRSSVAPPIPPVTAPLKAILSAIPRQGRC